MKYSEVINFWFHEVSPEQWYKKDEDFDKKIKERFLDLHTQVVNCELSFWRATPLGRVAEIIVIDQFSRNIYRNDPRSFIYDPMALTLAQEAISLKADQDLELAKKAFLYMPFMHSESKVIHIEAVELFSTKGLEYNLEFEMTHKEIIDRFSRYPHRNEILGRKSTPEEIEFLKQENSSF